MKKLFISVAAVLLTCNAFAETQTWDCGYCGEDSGCTPTNSVTATLNTADSTLTISGIGAMSNYDVPWSSSRADIKTLVINSGVTSIGQSAFFYCSSLTSVTIPNSVTSIGEQAFYGCSGLISVTIPNSVTSIGSYAFLNCSGLTAINVDNANTRYSSIDGVVYNKAQDTVILCPAGKGSVTIPNSVTSIGSSAFGGCSGLTAITIPNSVTSIGDGAFYGCRGLTSITIPNSVTSIGERAFLNCSGLTSVTIPNSVTSIGDWAFADCSGLTSVTIPNSVTSIGYGAFSGCSGLTSVTIPNSVTSIGSIGSLAFSGCTQLQQIIVGWTNPLSVSSDVFEDVNKILCKLVVPPGTASLYKAALVWRDFFNIWTADGLNNLKVTNYGISPAFDASITNYALIVPSAVSSINIEATAAAEDAKSVTGAGTQSLNVGENLFNITITAANDGIKTYSLAVFRMGGGDAPAAPRKDTLYIVTHDTVVIYHKDTIVFYHKDTVYIINGNNPTAILGVPNLTPLQIYPNPTTNGELRIESGELNAGDKVEIYNVNGTLVETRHATSLQGNSINIAHLSAGIYLVKVGNRVAKVVKQ
ncbi:hypothetical protein AGMMS4956_10730 [Bacteroidia bacterium]|nr:hypothetical protein AGMMS4956_10730 [Bacteroidia bacterium]